MGKTITIEYEDLNGNRTIREIEPIDIYDGDLLEAYCHLRGDWRHFRIRRIQSIIDSDGVIHDDPWEFFGIEPVDDLPSSSSHTTAARPVSSWQEKIPTGQATYHGVRNESFLRYVQESNADETSRLSHKADENLAIARELLKDSPREEDAPTLKDVLKGILNLLGLAYLIYFIFKYFF